VVGHGLAVIAMQSGVALHVLQDHPEKARASLEAIRATSRDSLNDLRRELGMLRTIDEPAAAGRTGCGRTELQTLVDRVRAGGVAVTSDLDPLVDGLPVEVRRAVYRVVQEALTNVLRHAGPDAAASVTLRGNGPTLEIDVIDTGTGPAATDGAGEGSGVRGMRDRVTSLGGQLTIGPGPSGGFRVHASIPLPRPATAPAGAPQ
jgi:signal transduction histidine kinase